MLLIDTSDKIINTALNYIQSKSCFTFSIIWSFLSQTTFTSNTHTSADFDMFFLQSMLLVSITPPERDLIAASYSWSKSFFSILQTNDLYSESSGHFIVKELNSSINSFDVISCNVDPSTVSLKNKTGIVIF